MSAFLADHYLIIKSLHLISLISWMAGLFYLPRLFVYHTQVPIGSDQDKLFQIMEAKLMMIIMRPAMILTWIFGLMLFFTPSLAPLDQGWVWIKAFSVIALTGFQGFLSLWRKAFVEGLNRHSESFFRKINEVPTLLMMIIVIMVVVKPF